MRFWRVVFLALPTLLALESAGAAVMTGVSSLDVANGTVSGVSISGNTVAFTLTVLQKSPIRLDFSYISGVNPAIPGPSPTTGYIVTMNVINALLPATGGGPDYMNGYDITNGATGNIATVTSSLFTDTAPTSTAFSVFYDNNSPGYTLPTGFRIGGMSGGGGAIYNGGTSTETFVLSNSGFTAGGGTRNSYLTFTANPEPATLLLGSLALIPAGMVARRRRKAAQEVVEAV